MCSCYKLRVICNHLLEFHCVAHREALSVGQAYQSVLGLGDTSILMIVLIVKYRSIRVHAVLTVLPQPLPVSTC